ncbi:beta-galactosidase GalA [Alteromonadaceae bacterium BrNp21-10]|nr:beta-galactosidase GalA [Alteromonadaceae bacterium BrNp21-10]
MFSLTSNLKSIAIFSGRLLALCLLLVGVNAFATETTAQPIREKIQLDSPWKFALGHATDRDKDFNHAKGYFSYLAKTGFGDGAASATFDDRAWRTVNIPHDWAVEMPFSGKASHSHGYKALGPGFPETSVGWYRHHFSIPEADLGKKLFLQFDGIQRAARVFVNGFLLGEENLGNIEQYYDITAYLNYGAENVIAVRADVSIEAGWYYEGAGINRHVYLHKVQPVHVEHNGTFIKTGVVGDTAHIRVDTEVVNQLENSAIEQLAAKKVISQQTIFDAQGNQVNTVVNDAILLATGDSAKVTSDLKVNNAHLWSLEDPYLYTLHTSLRDEQGQLLDNYVTRFGIRTIRFDADKGFFLNGKSIKLKGSNNHEDHAGVGTATPDELIRYRLQRLQSMGMNAYRASHAPASPALLNIADEMGMLVIDETRISGINDYHLNAVEQMILRGRNHPSIIMWSLGNEEWAIEGNIKGARIAQTMQSFARKLDPTRLNTIAISGGWGGISTTIGVMGVNYIKHGDTDWQHKQFPWQVILGTEETTTQQTRGIYFEDKALGHLPPQENGSSGGNAESGWKHYAERDYLAGIFYWTGFDYKGESTPYGFPAVSSQFGILDSSGFAKDGYYYLKAKWTDEPVLHVFPHWNWAGKEGEVFEVTAHSNADEVELSLNGVSLGKQAVPEYGHVSWPVSYQPGELKAVAYRNGVKAEETVVATTGEPSAIQLQAHQSELQADGHDVVVVNVSVVDSQGLVVPTADNLLQFSLQGPGKIIGVGNGNPSSHEDDVMVEKVSSQLIGDWQAPNPADSTTEVEFSANFDLPKVPDNTTMSLLLNALGESQSVWLNGKAIYEDAPANESKTIIDLAQYKLKETGNMLLIKAKPFPVWQDREGLFQFHPARFAFTTAAAEYQRKLFNGWAQVIVQSTGQTGDINLSVTSAGVQQAKLVIAAK